MPRHKKIEDRGIPININADDYELPDLSEQQMKFVVLVSQGKSLTQSYREAYDKEDWSDQALSSAASKLRRTENIKKWIAALQIEAMRQGSIKHTEYNVKLMELIEEARDKDQWGAVTGMMTTLGKSMGFLTDKVVVKDERTELKEQLERMDKLAPEISDMFKRKLSGVIPDFRPDKEKVEAYEKQFE